MGPASPSAQSAAGRAPRGPARLSGGGPGRGRVEPVRCGSSGAARRERVRAGEAVAGPAGAAGRRPCPSVRSRLGAGPGGRGLSDLCARGRATGGGCGGGGVRRGEDSGRGGGDTGVERSGRRDGPRGTGRGDQGAAPTSLRRQRPNAAASPSREPRRCLPGRVRAAAGVVFRFRFRVPVPVPHVFPVAPRGRAFPAAKPGAGAAARGRRRARIRRSLRHLPGGRAASGSSPPPAPARLPPQLRGAPPGEGLVRGLRSACSVPGGGGREAGSGAAQPPRGSPASLDPGKGGDRRDRAPRVAASAAWTRPNPRNTGPSWGSGHSVA